MENPSFSPEILQALLEQFTKSLQATVSLTQSLQSLQSEVVRNTTNISLLSGEVGTLRDRLKVLAGLVQGEGMGDSLYKSLIEMESRVRFLEKKNDNDDADDAGDQETNTKWHIAFLTISVSLISVILSMILSPILAKFLK